MNAKTNLQKEDPNYYKIGKKAEVRDLDTYYYLTIESVCAPENELFNQSIEAIYKIAYTLKFQSKERGFDFVVPKMEAFWWIAGGAENQKEFMNTPREEWHWKILIRLPDFIERDLVNKALQAAKDSKLNNQLLNQVKYESINEGRCVQVLHIGSYDKEENSLKKLHDLMESEGLKVNNYHHEIYLSDPGRTSEDKLRTILRYGVV